MTCVCGCGLAKPALSAFGSVGAKFIGLMKTERAYSLRLYNITGDHHNAGSTVKVDTLVDQNIPITDLTDEQIAAEYALCKDYLKD